MATAKLTKKDMQQDEFIEGVFDFGEWLEVHWRRVAIGLAVAIALVLAGVAWNGMRQTASQEANGLLATGIEAYAPKAGADGQTPPPRYAEALTLFDQAAAKAGSQGVGKVAQLFHARTLIAMSRAQEAVPALEALALGGDKSLAVEAKVVLADASEAAGNPDRAVAIFQELASAGKGAVYPQDAALLMLGGVRERQGKIDDARKAYAELIARYPQSPFAADAKERSSALTSGSR